LAPGKTRKKVIKGTGFKDEPGNLKNEGVGLKKEVIQGKIFFVKKGAAGEEGFFAREGFVGKGFLRKEGFFVRDKFPGKKVFPTGKKFAKEEVFLIKEEILGGDGFLTKKGARKKEKKKKADTGGFPNHVQNILRFSSL
jgi:hypothetical protein